MKRIYSIFIGEISVQFSKYQLEREVVDKQGHD